MDEIVPHGSDSAAVAGSVRGGCGWWRGGQGGWLWSGVVVKPGGRDEFLAVAPVVADGVLVPVVGQVRVVADDHLEVRRELPDDLMHEFEEAGDGHAVFVQGDVLQPASLFGHV